MRAGKSFSKTYRQFRTHEARLGCDLEWKEASRMYLGMRGSRLRWSACCLDTSSISSRTLVIERLQEALFDPGNQCHTLRHVLPVLRRLLLY